MRTTNTMQSIRFSGPVSCFLERGVRMIFIFLSVLFLGMASAAGAQEPDPEAAKIRIGRMSFGLVTGYYQPHLGTLNTILNDRGRAILQDPNFLLPGNPNLSVATRNIPAGQMSGAPWVGLESQWELSPALSVRLSGGVWRDERLVHDRIFTFLRSNLPEIEVPRSARYNLILDQFFLDWRYYLYNEPSHGRISLDLGLLGVTIGFLTLDSLVKVVHPAAPGGAFASLSSTESMGVAYTTRYGFSGEYHFTPKISLNLSGYYVFGKMTEIKVRRHFPLGFPGIPIPEPLSIRAGILLPTNVQPVPRKGDEIQHATSETVAPGVEETGPSSNLVLDLEGLELWGYLRFYF